jgi:hypothetical protein
MSETLAESEAMIFIFHLLSVPALKLALIVLLPALAAMSVFLLIREPRSRFHALVILLCAFTVTIWYCGSIYNTPLPQFANDIKKVVGPHALQKWALLTLSNPNPVVTKSDQGRQEIPLDDLPEVVRSLQIYGFNFYFAACDKRAGYIALCWISDDGDYCGIDIGAPSYEEGKEKFNYTGDFCIKWAPGMYFWCDPI